MCFFVFFQLVVLFFCVVVIYSIFQYCVNNEIIDYIINKNFCLFIDHLAFFFTIYQMIKHLQMILISIIIWFYFVERYLYWLFLFWVYNYNKKLTLILKIK